MSKNLVAMYENGEMDSYLDAEAAGAISARRATKVATGRIDSKRNKESYISASKKGRQSRMQNMASAAKKSSKLQGRRERDEMSELQKELRR